jgi:integrase
VRDKLRELREDISSSVRAPAGYTVRQAVEDWLESGLDGRSEATVSKYRFVPKPVVQQIGRAVLRDLTAHDVRRALTVEQAQTLLAVAGDLSKHRLGAYVVLCLQTGIRTEEARALTWSHVDLDGETGRWPAGAAEHRPVAVGA